MPSSPSGFRPFSSFIAGMSGVESVRWSKRFAWVKRCEDEKPVRLSRSRLSGSPEHIGAFTLADLVTAQGRRK